MPATCGPERRKQRGTLSRLRTYLATCVGSITLAIGGTALALSEGGDPSKEREFRAPHDAPLEWRQFASRLRSQLHARLSADENAIRKLNRLVEQRGATEPRILSILAKVWVSPAGAVERLRFEALDDETADSLRAVLLGSDMHAMPPADMLQPVSIKLSFEWAK